MGMAGFARSGGAKGTAGVQKVSTGSVMKASVARGGKSVSGEGKTAEDATASFIEQPVTDGRVPVLEPPVHVDLACTRPHAERKPVLAAGDVGIDISLSPDAQPVQDLNRKLLGEPTVPQNRPRDVI